jgi:hypothetical protein
MEDKNNSWGIGSVKTKIIGKVFNNQMCLEEDKWTLPRISPICEKCNNNEYYNISRSSSLEVFFIPMVKHDVKYSIVCPNCRETIELDFDEYLIIEPLIKANRKYENGKITEHEHEMLTLDILNKIAIKRR